MDKKSVLLITNEGASAREFAGVLESLGYHVCGTASNAEEAVRISNTCPPDIIIADLDPSHLNNATGLTPKIGKLPDVPVIFKSTRAGKNTPHKTKKHPRDVRFFDPFTDQDPANVINAAIDRYHEKSITNRERSLMRSIAETSPSAITVLDLAGKIIYANPQAEQVLGISRDTMHGRNYNDPGWTITDLNGNPFPDEDLPFTRVLESAKPVRDVRHAVRRPDGQTIFLSINASPFFNEEGKIEMVVAVIEDITEREKIQSLLRSKNEELQFVNEELQAAMEEIEATNEALLRKQQELTGAHTCIRESELRYHSLFNRMINGYALHEMLFNDAGVPVDFRFIDINPAFQELTGLGRDIIGKTIKEIQPDIEQYLIDTCGKVVMEGEPVRFENYSASLGKWFDIVVYRPMEKYFAVVFDDISEKKHYAERYRTLIESSPIAIVLIRDWKIIYANNAYLKLTGHDSLDEIMGKSRAEHVAPERREAIRELNRRRMAGEEVPGVYDSVGMRKDGTRFFYHITVRYLNLDDGPAILAFLEDITEKKQAEDTVRIASAIFQEFLSVHDDKLYGNVLSIVMSSLESPNGFFGLIDEEGNLVIPSITPEGWGREEGKEKTIRFPTSELDGLWGKSVKEMVTCVSNTPLPVPEGRIPIQRALSVPIIFRESVIGLFAVANKTFEYTSHDITLLEGIANFIAPVLDSQMRKEREETKRRLMENENRKSLREKETLLKEIHHRVKNNLQIITSLLNLQIQRINTVEAVQELEESKNRIQAMATIHEKLYQSKSLSGIDFADYVLSLTQQLSGIYGVDLMKTSIKVETAPVWLSIDEAIPAGLAVNELISNALKHAYPAGTSDGGEIKITFSESSNEVRISVEDNGIGLPDSIDPRKSKSLGLNLVHILIEEQLRGTVSTERDSGTRFILTFNRRG